MYIKITTLGPRGPLRQSGVEVVSQLAQRRARSGSGPELLLPLPRPALLPVGEEEECLDCNISQQKLGIYELLERRS